MLLIFCEFVTHINYCYFILFSVYDKPFSFTKRFEKRWKLCVHTASFSGNMKASSSERKGFEKGKSFGFVFELRDKIYG